MKILSSVSTTKKSPTKRDLSGGIEGINYGIVYGTEGMEAEAEE